MTSEHDDLDAKVIKLFDQALKQSKAPPEDWVAAQKNVPEVIKNRTLQLLSFEQASAKILQTGQAILNSDIDLPVPKRIGAYKVVEQLGHGGMGAVYKGLRDSGDFDHDVAIKLIKPTALSDRLIERFERERQILARFTHPNIARLYDGGTTTDGVPYFIMEYIDGQPIISWANQNHLSIKARLKLFKAACKAVRYAHQNLIIHRDITPNNVLVTQAGIVKLIDFGIAKPNTENEPAEGTSHSLASLSFTPGFAAPERSNSGAVNTLSDIYSLGKLLEALLAAIAIPSDLKAIIDKAAQIDPEKRYISADTMIADIDRYNTGYPVQAHKGQTFYSGLKFIRRKKLAVSLGTLAFTGLIGGLIVTTNLYKQTKFAKHAAESRFSSARELNKKILFDIYPELTEITGAFEVRQNLANVLRDFTADLANDPFASDEILLDVGVSKTQLADLYGGIGIPNLGDADEAVRLLEEAVETLSILVSRSPENGEAFEKMAVAKRYLTAQYNPTSDKNRQKSMALNDELLRQTRYGADQDWPEARAIRRIFWQARSDQLRLLLIDGKVDEALEKVIKWRAEFTPDVQNSIDRGPRMAAFFAAREGELQQKAGAIEKALPPLEEALSYYAVEAAKNPKNYNSNYTAIILRSELANGYRKTENFVKANKYSMEAVAGSRRLVDADPSNRGANEQLVQSLTSLGRIKMAMGELKASTQTLQEAISIAQGLLKAQPDNEKAIDILLWAEAGIVITYATDKNIKSACEHWEIINSLITRAKKNDVLRPFTATRLSERLKTFVDVETCDGIK